MNSIFHLGEMFVISIVLFLMFIALIVRAGLFIEERLKSKKG